MGRRGDCAGASSLFLQLCFGCQVIPIVFHCWTDLVNLFSWPTRSPFLHGKHVISMLCFPYFFSVTMPGDCRSQLSWIPSLLLGSTILSGIIPQAHQLLMSLHVSYKLIHNYSLKYYNQTHPLEISSSTTASLELSIALISGVPPLMVCASISAPLSSKS